MNHRALPPTRRQPRIRALLAALLASAHAAAAEPAAAPTRVCVDDFERAPPGRLPPGWEAHADKEAAPPYAVVTDANGRYLEARDRGESVILGRKLRVDIEQYPFLSFRWRVHAVPRGGDERFGPTGDSAAAVYVTYRTSFGFIPIAVKYVWSSTLPVGTALQRSGTGRPWIVVAASGTEGLGTWQRAVFDVRATYRDTYGGRPPRQIVGVGLLSDANATKSTAYADYDDICFLSSADADSGVRRVVPAD